MLARFTDTIVHREGEPLMWQYVLVHDIEAHGRDLPGKPSTWRTAPSETAPATRASVT
jgi:hypothetical protein